MNYVLRVHWVDGQMQYPRILDEPIDEDSGDAFSPEQPGSQESQGSAASPGEVRTIEESSPVPNNLLQVVLPLSFDFRNRTQGAHGAKIQNLVIQVLQYTEILFFFFHSTFLQSPPLRQISSSLFPPVSNQLALQHPYHS